MERTKPGAEEIRLSRVRLGRTSLLAVLAITVPMYVRTAGAQPQHDYQGNCADAGCHGGYKTKSSVHSPVQNDACDSCHEDAGEQGHKFRLTEQGAELCTQCHDEVTEDLLYLHGPVAAGTCTACHDPHASDHPQMLPGPSRDLCVGCHTTLQTRIAGSAHTHPPATEDCLVCHDPHGSANRLMLTAELPELCTDCHDDIADIMDEAAVQHDALTTGKSCTGCHNPHASGLERLLLADPMELCLSCHDRELPSGDGKLLNIGQLLKDNPDHHGPIRENNCTACHQVHGGEFFRMLSAAYPPQFYASFNEERYALCFECHEVDMLLDEKTDDLTDFRNGDRNLHYLHVNRQVKGRTCRACHNVHGSRRPKHITETAPFGAWEIPLNYEQTADGGSCQPGCHKLYRYDRTSPVENLPQ